MAFYRTPASEAPELDDLTPEPGDGLVIALLKPYVWLHGLLIQPFRNRGMVVTKRAIGWRALTSEQLATLPSVVREFLETVESAVKRVGFNEAVWHGNFSRPNGEAITVMSISPGNAGKDLCIASIAYVPRRFTMTGVSFQTHMTDGLLLVTGNERRIVPATQLPMRDVVTFDRITDLAQLYDIHHRRTAAATRSGHVPIEVGWNPPATHPLELFQRLADVGIEEAARAGRIESPVTEDIRLTLKGAILSTWSNMWPFDWIADWRERRRAARVLRSL